MYFGEEIRSKYTGNRCVCGDSAVITKRDGRCMECSTKKYSFISNINDKLADFGYKLDEKNQTKLEVLDPLNPRLFVGKTFDEITANVLNNQATYFNEALNQLENLSPISKSSWGNQKVLKTSNNQ